MEGMMGYLVCPKKVTCRVYGAFNSKHSIYRGDERGICNQVYTSSYVHSDCHRLINKT